MGYIDDAKELIQESKATFIEIKKAYDDSLNDKEVKSSLLIKIKNFMENLRSALDFTAYDLFDKYGTSTTTNPKIYFPYAKNGLSKADFQTKKIIEKNLPGVIANRPDIVAKIESFQWFSCSDNRWLPKFMDLNNENKHQRLSPQTRKEIKVLRIHSGNIEMIIQGSYKILENTIKLGDAIIKGDQYLSADNLAIIKGNAKQEVITWVSFHFTDSKEPVLPFLESALNGTEKIVSELEGM